jgi:protein involved in polysaccharide export with SLBB domain
MILVSPPAIALQRQPDTSSASKINAPYRINAGDEIEVLVWGDYTVHIDLPIYPVDLRFQPASKSKKRSM